MGISINEIKSGLTILVSGIVYQVVESQPVKPGKGASFIRTKLRNLKNSNIQEMTFRGDEKIEEAYVEERKLQYLYHSGEIYHFMDQDNFEEITVSRDSIGEKIKFLKDNLDVTAFFYKNDVLSVNLPHFIEFNIVHTEAGIKGDTSRSGTKPAKIDTGANILVPLFINSGDKIKVDTRTGEYVERAY
ncbi:MAG: elongation factor P [Candidatus Omnitrophica bacterium]|nr:elongation factor P [Candidatus Omnitrophota bacterium]